MALRPHSPARDGHNGDGAVFHRHGDRHDHDHADHPHAHRHAAGSFGAMAVALVVTLAFAGVEAVGGWWAGSLALLSDAGHMVTDAAALGLALFAQAVARRPPSARNSFGYARAEVMGAFLNAMFMLFVVVLICYEAVQRLLHPAPVAGAMVAGIAAAGLAVNLVCARLLHAHRDNLNTRAAYLHVLADALGSVAALIAGAVVWATGWLAADPLLSFVVSALMLFSTWRLLRQSTNVLMEGVPPHLSYDEIGQALAGVPHVRSVHDLHVWYMSAARIALSAHVLIDNLADWPVVLNEARKVLRERFAIDHVTLQPDFPGPMTSPAQRVIRVAEVRSRRNANG